MHRTYERRGLIITLRQRSMKDGPTIDLQIASPIPRAGGFGRKEWLKDLSVGSIPVPESSSALAKSNQKWFRWVSQVHALSDFA